MQRHSSSSLVTPKRGINFSRYSVSVPRLTVSVTAPRNNLDIAVILLECHYHSPISRQPSREPIRTTTGSRLSPNFAPICQKILYVTAHRTVRLINANLDALLEKVINPVSTSHSENMLCSSLGIRSLLQRGGKKVGREKCSNAIRHARKSIYAHKGKFVCLAYTIFYVLINTSIKATRRVASSKHLAGKERNGNVQTGRFHGTFNER